MAQKPHGRILVPQPVSFEFLSRAGRPLPAGKYFPNRTKAFVPAGARLPQGLPPEQEANVLRRLAQESDYYIKSFSARQGRIAEILSTNGIPIEMPIQKLGGGKALFRREGFGLDSAEGRRLFARYPEEYEKQMIEILVRSHFLGITHGHPHVGNWAITKGGKLILLDLRKAAISRQAQKQGLDYRPSQRELQKAMYVYERLVDNTIRQWYHPMELLEADRSRMTAAANGIHVQSPEERAARDAKELVLAEKLPKPKLLGMLKPVKTRALAVRAIAHTEGRKAIPLIRKILEAKIVPKAYKPFTSFIFQGARRAAFEELRMLGDPELVNASIRIVRAHGEFSPKAGSSVEDTYLQSVAARFLGDAKARQAVPFLLRKLSSKDRGLWAEAAVSLGKLGDGRAVPHLKRVVQEFGTIGNKRSPSARRITAEAKGLLKKLKPA